MDSNGNELLYQAEGTAVGPAGSQKGSVKVEMPAQTYLLWGQRLEMYARKQGFTEVSGQFAVSAKFWRSGDPDSDLLQKLEGGEVEGDSFLTPDLKVKSQLNVASVLHDIQIKTNSKGRISGFEFGPIEAPSGSEALTAGEMVLARFERAAAIGGVPLYCAYILAIRPGLEEQRKSILLPYPDVQLPSPDSSPFPIMETLLSALAEGRRNPSIFYRALIFFKIVDTFIERIQPKLNHAFHDLGLICTPLDLSFPSDLFSKISKPLVGIKMTTYRDSVRNRIRDVIAHLDPDSSIVPFNVVAESEVRTASIALHYCATEITNYVASRITQLSTTHLPTALAFSYPVVDRRRKRTKR